MPHQEKGKLNEQSRMAGKKRETRGGDSRFYSHDKLEKGGCKKKKTVAAHLRKKKQKKTEKLFFLFLPNEGLSLSMRKILHCNLQMHIM